MMKQLVVVRHGTYGEDDHLDDRGKAQMHALAEKLRLFIGDASVLLLTSTADRASESAEVLSAELGVVAEPCELLWSESGREPDFPATLRLIGSRSDSFGVVMLVTHYEFTEDLPRLYAREVLGISLGHGEIYKGEAWVLDCVRRTLERVTTNLV